MDSNANSTEQKSSDEEENGVVESLLTTAYSMQQSSAMVESPSERSSLLLLDPEINSAFDGKQYIKWWKKLFWRLIDLSILNSSAEPSRKWYHIQQSVPYST